MGTDKTYVHFRESDPCVRNILQPGAHSLGTWESKTGDSDLNGGRNAANFRNTP